MQDVLARETPSDGNFTIMALTKAAVAGVPVAVVALAMAPAAVAAMVAMVAVVAMAVADKKICERAFQRICMGRT